MCEIGIQAADGRATVIAEDVIVIDPELRVAIHGYPQEQEVFPLTNSHSATLVDDTLAAARNLYPRLPQWLCDESSTRYVKPGPSFQASESKPSPVAMQPAFCIATAPCEVGKNSYVCGTTDPPPLAILNRKPHSRAEQNETYDAWSATVNADEYF